VYLSGNNELYQAYFENRLIIYVKKSTIEFDAIR